MTPIGHLLTGTAIGVLSVPKSYSKRKKLAHTAIFALLATIPDWPLPGWGHERYYFSHSLYVNLLIIAAMFFIVFLIPVTRRITIKNWPIGIWAVFAWLSHLLLDSFYNHGYGVAIFWPFSSSKLVLPIPWLSVFHGSLLKLTLNDVSVFVLELVTFFPLVLLAMTVRRIRCNLSFMQK